MTKLLGVLLLLIGMRLLYWFNITEVIFVRLTSFFGYVVLTFTGIILVLGFKE